MLNIPRAEFSGRILLLLATLHQNILLDTHSSQQNSPKLITRSQVARSNTVVHIQLFSIKFRKIFMILSYSSQNTLELAVI